jgi:hypothetical protein
LKGDLLDPALKGRLMKVRHPKNETLFSLRFSIKYRAILDIQGSDVSILDIVNHDNLIKLFGKGGKYA